MRTRKRKRNVFLPYNHRVCVCVCVFVCLSALCVCVCVCVYVCIYAGITCALVHIEYAYAYVCVCLPTHTHTQTHVYPHTLTHTHTHTHAHTHAHPSICFRTCFRPRPRPTTCLSHVPTMTLVYTEEEREDQEGKTSRGGGVTIGSRMPGMSMQVYTERVCSSRTISTSHSYNSTRADRKVSDFLCCTRETSMPCQQIITNYLTNGFTLIGNRKCFYVTECHEPRRLVHIGQHASRSRVLLSLSPNEP